MPYLNLDPNYFEHPKTRRLVGLLGPMADVLPLRLWAYCAKIHPVDGAMKGYAESEVESLIGWTGTRGAAIKALLRVGFLKPVDNAKRPVDNGFSCVDWKQHQGHLEAFSRRGKVAAKARWAAYASSNASSNAKDGPKQCPSRTTPAVPATPPKTTTTAPSGAIDPAQEALTAKDQAAEESRLLSQRIPFGKMAGVHILNMPEDQAQAYLGSRGLSKDLRRGLELRIKLKREEATR